MGFYLPRKIRSCHPEVLAKEDIPSDEPAPPASPRRPSRRPPPPVPVMHDEALGVPFARFHHLPPEVWNHLVGAMRDGLQGICGAIDRTYGAGMEDQLSAVLDQGIPQAVYALGRDVMEGVLSRERGFLGSHLTCEKCGEALELEGNKPRSFLTRLGEITVCRSYYHCKCGHSAFPLDTLLGIEDHDALRAIQQEVAFLAADLSYARAEATVKRLLPIAISNETVQRMTATVAGQIQAEQEADHGAAFADPSQASFPQPAVIPTHPVAVLAVDGGMCRIRNQEEFREFKVGVLGTVDPSKATADEPAPVEDKHYVAHFADADRIFEYIAVEYHRLGLDRCPILHVLGDGAEWIWARGKTLCTEGQKYVPTLDYWHAAEHISGLARTIFGAETPATKEWSKAMRDSLDEGRVDDFMAALELQWQRATEEGDLERTEAVRVKLQYFQERRDLLTYKQCRELGLPIGSGIVEGGIRFVGKDRLHRTGMRWLVAGAEAILQLRTTDASGNREAFSKRHATKRLQAFHAKKAAWLRAA